MNAMPEGFEVTVPAVADRSAILVDQMVQLYAEVYAEPPYRETTDDVADFVKRYEHERQELSFRLAVVHGPNSELNGFAYGLSLAPATTWWQGMPHENMPGNFTQEDGRRTFVIMELLVREAARNRGIAHALHDALVSQSDAERLTLAVRPDAPRAIALYASLGYRLIGTKNPGKTHRPTTTWSDLSGDYAPMIQPVRSPGVVAPAIST